MSDNRQAGKGSKRRPESRPGAYAEGWERVFGRKRKRALKDGEECGHRGCKNHITHPCEGCGRVGARGEVWE
jgi:hypothetical protein